MMLERDMRLVRLTGARYHAAMISCADSRRDRAPRQGATACRSPAASRSTTSTLNENDIGDYRTFCKLSPPLRHEDDRQAVVDGAGRRASSTSSSPTTIRRTSRRSACPSPRPPTARSASRPCCRRRCASSMRARSRCRSCCARCRRARPRSSACPAGGSRRARRPISILFDPDEPYVLDKRDAALALEELALRRGAPRRAACRTTFVGRAESSSDDRGRATSERADVAHAESMNWSPGRAVLRRRARRSAICSARSRSACS